MLSLITAQVGHQNECRGDVGRTVEMHKKKSCETHTGEKCRYKRQILKSDLKYENGHLIPFYPKIHIISITKLSFFYS